MKAMIFAAGLGTRLKPLTDTMPKALIPIDGKPLLEHLLLKMKNAGFNQIVINVHHFADQIVGFLHDNNNFGLQIFISNEQNLLLETGGGLRNARSFFNDNQPFLVHNVDILSNLDLQHLAKQHQQTDIATLVVSDRKTSRYLLFDDNLQLNGWMNKLTNETKPADLQIDTLRQLAFSGIQIISPRIFEAMSDFPEKFSIIDVYLKICKNQAVRAFAPSNFQMVDVGKLDSLTEAQSFVSRWGSH